MKKVLGVFFVSLLFFSMVSAAGFSSFTGRVVQEVGGEISNLSEEELMSFYEENKGLIENLSEEEIQELYEENKNKIPDEAIEFYEENKNSLDVGLLDSFSGIPTGLDDLGELDEAGVDFLLNFISCSLIKSVFDSQDVELEIPEEVPIENDVFVLFIDETFLASVRIEDKKVSE